MKRILIGSVVTALALTGCGYNPPVATTEHDDCIIYSIIDSQLRTSCGVFIIAAGTPVIPGREYDIVTDSNNYVIEIEDDHKPHPRPKPTRRPFATPKPTK